MQRPSATLAALVALGGCGPGRSEPEAGPIGAVLLDSAPPPGPAGEIRLRFTNRTDLATYGAVEIRMEPGMWLRPITERLDYFRLGPKSTRTVSVPYRLPRLSPEARLRIRAGAPESDRDRPLHIPEPVLVRSIPLGGAPEARAFLDRFTVHRTPRLTLYALKGSVAAAALPSIAATRDSAVDRLAALLAVAPPPGLRLVFYPDSASKTTDTRHSGNGWSDGTLIVEIYNEEVKLDPYHELAHSVASQLGGPPPMFDEGFATYASELLGADALRFLGAPGKSIDRVTCEAARAGTLFSLDSLLALEAIGTTASRPDVSYPESASVVKYLIERFGRERFRAAYRELQQSSDSAGVATNRRVFEREIGTLSTVERDWLAQIRSLCPAS